MIKIWNQMNSTLTKKVLVAFITFALLYLLLIPIISFPYNSFLKLIPIFCLILATWQSPVNKNFKFLLMGALSFSLLGDFILTVPVSTSLQYGIVFFMLAHFCYIFLFLSDCSYQFKRLMLYFPVLLMIILSFKLLNPYLGELRPYVIIYMCVIMTMVLTAFLVRHNAFLTATGALIFLASDLTLAFNIFVFMNMKLDILVMFLYYFAQLLLISSLLFKQKVSMMLYPKS